MEFLGEVLAWYTDPANWTGSNSIPLRLWEHLSLTVASLAAGLAIALPIGLYIGHTGRGAGVAVAISNIGRAVPSLGWLGIAYPITTGLFARGGLGFLPAFIGLVALAIPPVVTNTYAGLRDVDPDLREAARGMGMREMQLLARVEVPVALTVILAGVRVVGGLGGRHRAAGAWSAADARLLHPQGLALSDEVRVFAAALLVAVAGDPDRAGLRLAAAPRRLARPGGADPRADGAVAGARRDQAIAPS